MEGLGSLLWQKEPAGSLLDTVSSGRMHRQGQKRATSLYPRDSPAACRRPAMEATKTVAQDNAKLATPQQKAAAGSA